MKSVLLPLFLVSFVAGGRAADELHCLTEDEQRAAELYVQLQQQAYAALDRRDGAYDQLKSAEQIRLYQHNEMRRAEKAIPIREERTGNKPPWSFRSKGLRG